MSAQRKLISILAHSPYRLATPRSSLFTIQRSRSIVTTPTLFRPSTSTVAERASESNKDDTKPVPSEQLTEEAKQAEPDAAEQVEEVSLHSISRLGGPFG